MKQYKIGYITGVFDMLHIGHLRLLRAAKEQCDRLIVGVCTDETVLEYSQEKPIVPFEERIQILSAVRYVDQVIPQSSVDKPEIWNSQPFDVVFRGDDEKNSTLHLAVERPLLEAGCRLVLLTHTGKTASVLLDRYLERRK